MSKLIHQNASRVYLSIDQSDLEPFDNQWANDDHHPSEWAIHKLRLTNNERGQGLNNIQRYYINL